MYREDLQKYMPQEFDLANYDNAANMNLLNWGMNLFCRSILFHEIKELLTEESFEDLIYGTVTFSETEAKGIKDFILGLDKDELLTSVRELRWFEVINMADELNTREDVIAARSNFYDDSGNLDIKSIFEASNSIINNDYDVNWLGIDLHCSDNEIISAFSDWLIQARKKELNRELKSRRRDYKIPNLNQVAFRKCHDARILPYIDLVVWNRRVGNKVTSKILGDILFPDPRDLSDKTARVNDTIKPLVNKMLSFSMLKRIFNVIGDENRKKSY